MSCQLYPASVIGGFKANFTLKMQIKKPQADIHLGVGRDHISNQDFDKLRWGYYTPVELAEWMVCWAIRSDSDTILEPSSGNGAFLVAATDRLLGMGCSAELAAKNIFGLEIVDEEANIAREKLWARVGELSKSMVKTGDFFAWFSEFGGRNFDAVIGNPPFIRYQIFPEPHRNRAMKIMSELGMTPNRLTNIWVPFVVAAAAALKVGGRLALVLPAELLQVGYASQLRSFLTDKFQRIDIIACNELFFENAEQEVVLLLADGALEEASTANVCQVALTETEDMNGIIKRNPITVLSEATPKVLRHDSEKWLKYFLSEREIGLMRELRESKVASPLSSHASIDVWIVTGKNEFFIVDSAQIKEFNLQWYAIPAISRSSQTKGTIVTEKDWLELASSGNRVHLLNFPAEIDSKIEKGILRYIKYWEKSWFNSGYKCSIRKQWYVVPSIWTPDAFMFRQIYDFPRIVENRAGAVSTDTIHRLRSHVPMELLVPNIYTHLTGASAEIEGRSYGGGVLELEPTEAERILVPSILRNCIPLNEIDRLVRAGRLDDVLKENDRVILMDWLGLSTSECETLRNIWIKMRDRRLARKRKGKSIVI